MRRHYPGELMYQVFALLIAFIVVHAAYLSVIRPAALEFQLQEAAAMRADPGHVAQQSFAVVIKDYEQEACFVLMLWALAILGYKGLGAWRQQRLLERDLLQLPEGMPIGAEDLRELADRMHDLPATERHALLPRTLVTAIERFAASRDVQAVSTAAQDVCDAEGERL